MKNSALPDGFFLGQIPPNWNEYVRKGSWEDGHNNRVKVRIPSIHSKGPEILDKDLPWAIVAQSTSAGNASGSSTGLVGGEWVIGFYLDSDYQIPVITQVLGKNEVSRESIKTSQNGTTEFKPVSRYNSGLVAQSFQITAGPPPEKPAEPSREDFNKALASTETPPEQPAEGDPDLFNPDAPDPEPPAETAEQPATIPVASDIPQQIPPPATYAPQPVGSKTADGATISSEIKQRYPGGPRYQTVTSGLGDGAPQTRWIDNPRDPKFDKARADAGKPPRSDKTDPGGMLW